mmetsp:Transcript_25520/g.64869  ORF Transcript_25520/g.64869 Transcript_25520/m.64869 type:complete len:271 (+) Transcript_25520:932-1744(+)
MQLLHQRLDLRRRLELAQVEAREQAGLCAPGGDDTPGGRRAVACGPAERGTARVSLGGRVRGRRGERRDGRSVQVDGERLLARGAVACSLRVQSVDVLAHASAAERVAAAGEHDVLAIFVAQAAVGALEAAGSSTRGASERGAVLELGILDLALRVEDEIRVVDGLAQPREQVEDVGVVVQQGARLDVCAELRLALRVETVIKVILPRVEKVGFYGHDLGRKHHLVRAARLGAPQQDLVEHAALELDKRRAPRAHVAKLFDRVDDVLIEE